MRAHERLLNYVRVWTTSDETSGTHPSAAREFDLAHILVKELKELGLEDAAVDEQCYLYATLPATPGLETEPVMGLIAHMDTAAFNGKDVKPRIVENYDGGDIVLNQELGVVMSPAAYPELLRYIGQELIVTDGTTLLGADDKAGIAEIMTMLEILIAKKLPHGTIRIAFTPDEEIGEGADHFDVERFGASYAYTVDGGALGEIEYENFNAASAKITIHGNSIHPGDAKNRMVNAVLLAMEFNSMLPPCETPAHTEGYEGFYHLLHCEGAEEQATLSYIIRDHDRTVFESRKATMERIAAYLNEKYGAGTVKLELRDSYYNMKEKILPHMDIIERAKEAFEKNGVTPEIVPIRGGTDGARLSFMGLPCPNLCTGGHNFHGKFEYIPIRSMDRMTDILVSLSQR